MKRKVAMVTEKIVLSLLSNVTIKLLLKFQVDTLQWSPYIIIERFEKYRLSWHLYEIKVIKVSKVFTLWSCQSKLSLGLPLQPPVVGSTLIFLSLSSLATCPSEFIRYKCSVFLVCSVYYVNCFTSTSIQVLLQVSQTVSNE